MITTCAAIASAGAGVHAWLWLAAFATNIVTRAVLAYQFEAANPPIAPSSPPAIAYFTSHAIDVALWALLFGAIGNAAQLFAAGAGFAAGGALLLAALTFGGWKRTWLPMLAGWVGVSVVMLARIPA
ncbi:MAG TPA: hypothetical protein VEN28_08400, partial [Burkholderiaceae bacterium]|nr:hypothetical protein [Burkholderiaceae bacterium]